MLACYIGAKLAHRPQIFCERYHQFKGGSEGVCAICWPLGAFAAGAVLCLTLPPSHYLCHATVGCSDLNLKSDVSIEASGHANCVFTFCCTEPGRLASVVVRLSRLSSDAPLR